MKPKRIQRKRTKGWKMPPNTVYVGRPTKWGNPYAVPYPSEAQRAAIVANHRDWIIANQQSAERWRLPIAELRGKNLACWCPLNKPCHADVLLEIANREWPREAQETPKDITEDLYNCNTDVKE
jgi:hypothetical protein